MPEISIIVPAYNAENYIRECLNSIVSQTFKDKELLIIDDGSTDSTGRIVDEYERNYSFVRAYHQENKGLYRTREIAIGLAKGNYIGWVDADDYILPEMYEKLYNAIQTNNSELAICGYEFFPERINTKDKWVQPYKGKVDIYFIEHNSQPWNKLVKKELINRLCIEKHFVDCHDEIYIRVLMEAKNPVVINEDLYMYRATGGMSSSYKNVEHYEKYIEASKKLLNIMKSVTNDKYWLDYFKNRITYYRLMTLIVASNAEDKSKYCEVQEALRSENPQFYKNQHYWPILINNYGKIKSIIIGSIVPKSYDLTKLICKVAFK